MKKKIIVLISGAVILIIAAEVFMGNLNLVIRKVNRM